MTYQLVRPPFLSLLSLYVMVACPFWLAAAATAGPPGPMTTHCDCSTAIKLHINGLFSFSTRIRLTPGLYTQTRLLMGFFLLMKYRRITTNSQ